VTDAAVPPEITDWFAGRGWRVRRHQAEMLSASDAGKHAMLVADTGAGIPAVRQFADLSADEKARLSDLTGFSAEDLEAAMNITAEYQSSK